MSEKIKKIVEDNEVIVFVISQSKYSKKLWSTTKLASSMFVKICFISLNKPYNNLLKSMEKNKIPEKKFHFIDCVTKKIKNVKDTKNVTYVSSPQAFTELNITINKTLQKEEMNVAIFDSLSTLLVYGDPAIIIKFVHSLISMFRTVGVKSIFTILKEDVKSDLLKDLSMFADKVVNL